MKRKGPRLFRCPHCKDERLEPLANEVGHRCTHNRNRWTYYVLVEEETE